MNVEFNGRGAIDRERTLLNHVDQYEREAAKFSKPRDHHERVMRLIYQALAGQMKNELQEILRSKHRAH